MALTLMENRMVNDLRRAEREHRLATAQLTAAREAMTRDIERNGDIETDAHVYSIAYDPSLRRFVLTETPIPFRGLPAEEVE